VKLLWDVDAWEDYVHWQKTDRAILAKINDLIRDARRSPFAGLGKPEPLKDNLKGYWSRRITGEHRLIYRVTGTGDSQQLEIAQCRYHY
jgi:toxin YoeB